MWSSWDGAFNILSPDANAHVGSNAFACTLEEHVASTADNNTNSVDMFGLEEPTFALLPARARLYRVQLGYVEGGLEATI